MLRVRQWLVRSMELSLELGWGLWPEPAPSLGLQSVKQQQESGRKLAKLQELAQVRPLVEERVE